MSASFAKAAGNDLAALLDGRIAASEYLGGKSSLEEMERELLCLKGEEAFRRIFFTEGRGAAPEGSFCANERISLG